MPENVSQDWRNYHHKKFIDRPESLRYIYQWITTSSDKQVLLFVGPPGSGKTWVLNEIEFRLKNGPLPQRAIPLFVLKLDAPTLINRSAQKREQILKHPETGDWIRAAYTQAGLEGYTVPHYDPHLDISAALQLLVDALCTENGQLEVVLLVDGYDELEGYDPIGTDTHRSAETLSDRILVPFIQKPCVHMVITHRDPGGLHHDALRSTQERVVITTLDPPISAYAQYVRFCTPEDSSAGKPAAAELLSPADFARWQSQLKYYQWDLPYVNDHIFYSTIVLPGGKLETIELWMLVECVRDLLEKNDPENGIKHYPALSDGELELLEKIASLGDDFTNDDLQDRIGINVFSDEFKKFMTVYGIISALPRSQRYVLIASLRRLLLDLSAMGPKEVGS